jgi:hypothetical protein
MSQILRYPLNRTYTLATEAAAKVISMECMAGGSVETTATVTIAVYGCNRDNPDALTFVVAEDEDGTAVSMTITDAKCRALPAACYTYRYIKLVAAAGGTVYLHQKS